MTTRALEKIPIEWPIQYFAKMEPTDELDKLLKLQAGWLKALYTLHLAFNDT